MKTISINRAPGLAYLLYEHFRPVIPEGVKGWSVNGVLDLGLIGRLAKEKP